MSHDEFERAITHTAYAPVARMMGYTVSGMLELCKVSAEFGMWRTFGVTRKGVQIDGKPGPHRVAVMIDPKTGRYVFSVGPNAFQLTASAREAERIRREIAQAVVNAVNSSRDKETRMVIAAAQRSTEGEEPRKAQVTDATGAPETLIIWPVAPRDPRGI